MPVKIDPSGRRSVQVETEVPGTLEDVWQAIATGPGLSGWFVPAKFETDEGGAPTRLVMDFGPGMESVASVTAWDPPRHFAGESHNHGPNGPAMLTEWSIEARAGGTCIVRVVHSMMTTSDAWDKELEGTETGWPGFFRTLRLYLQHFPGQTCHAIRMMAMASKSEAEVWSLLTQSLGLANAPVGQRAAAPPGAPPFRGRIEYVDQGPMYDLLLHIDQPAPGIAAFGVFSCGGPVMVSGALTLYGGDAPATVARYESQWQEWLGKLFPAAAGAST